MYTTVRKIAFSVIPDLAILEKEYDLTISKSDKGWYTITANSPTVMAEVDSWLCYLATKGPKVFSVRNWRHV